MAVLRPERPGDEPAIHAVVAAAFPTADEARLVDALRAAEKLVISVVAEVEGEMVGHVGFSPIDVAGEPTGLGLAPLSVAPEHQRRGIGAELVRAGLAQCRADGVGFVVLLGSPDYYGRFGFRRASGWGLANEYGATVAFQALELREGAIPAGGGLVRYAPEFAALGEEDTAGE